MKKYVIYNLSTKKYVDTINDVSFLESPTLYDKISEYKRPEMGQIFDSEENALQYIKDNETNLFIGAWEDDIIFDIRPIYVFKNPLEY